MRTNESESQMITSPNYNAAIESEKDPQVAYEKTAAERKAIPVDEVLTMNVDGPTFASMALGARRSVRALEPQLAELPDYDTRAPQKLEVLALAFLHANTVHVSATRLPDDLAAMLEEGVSSRNRFRPVCAALVARGLIQADAFSACTWQAGFVNVGNDLQIITRVCLDNWSRIARKCPVDRGELERARKLATLMLRQSGERKTEPAASVETANERNRSFTLLVRCFDEVCRGVGYVRWHEGDAEQFAPSLYKGRRRSSKKDDAEPDQPTPTQPVINASPSPVAPVTNLNAPSPFDPSAKAPANATAKIPGGSPFIQ